MRGEISRIGNNKMYLWNDELLENIVNRWKVIKILIYGMCSSSNLAECKETFPQAYEIVMCML